MDSSTAFLSSLVAGENLKKALNHQITGIPVGCPEQWNGSKADRDTSSSPLPKCPMIYAIVTDTKALDYLAVSEWEAFQPRPVEHNCSRYGPPLVPLNMASISLDVECYISTGFVTVEGIWNLDFVKGGMWCDCLLAVPMHAQGTVAGVELDLGGGRLYTTLIIPKSQAASYGTKKGSPTSSDDTGTYNPELFSLTLPEVHADTSISLRMTWFQAMEFSEGFYSIEVPFVFPQYILPGGEELANVSNIKCTINSGTLLPVEVGQFHHPMQELLRENGRVSFAASIHNEPPEEWCNKNFIASYKVWSDGIFPNLIVQESTPGDPDPRGIFCLSVSPPDPESVQGFQRAVVFLLDRSGSMSGKPMDDARNALFFALCSLQNVDQFNIIAFDHEQILFSSQLQNVSGFVLSEAQEWIAVNCQARGGTNILTPLQLAMQMLHNVEGYVPYIFLITDGAVTDERRICHLMQNAIGASGASSPRISTFGIGHYCNYYFLKMLAVIGRGLSDVAFGSDKLRKQMDRLLIAASTPLLTNIFLDLPAGCEVYPFPIADLFCGNPLIVSGRFHGNFPDAIRVVGFLPNQTKWDFVVSTQIAHHIPLRKVFAKQRLDLLTALAWLRQDRQVEQEL